MGRVVQVIAPATFGGAETVVKQLLAALRLDGVPCTVVALGVFEPRTHPWVCALREAGYDVRCPVPSRRQEYRELADILREPGVVAVHSHAYRADFAAWMARPRGIRWVSTAHGFTGGGPRLRLYEAMDRWVLQRADRVLAVSSRLVALLRRGRGAAERVVLVRNVPDSVERPERAAARAELGLPAHLPLVGWVGRLSHEKGADRLPGLFSSPRSACTLVLIGDGPLRESTLGHLSALPHLEVLWLGVQRDVGRLLGAFDLLVLPSRTEGMPMVVLEAMTAGTPVVAFDVGDVAQAVGARTGWCVAADDLPAFANAIAEAIGNPAERQTRGDEARLHLRAHFSVSAWVATHKAAYGLAPAPS